MRTDNNDLFMYSIESLSNHGYILKNVYFDLHKQEKNLITTEYEDKFSSQFLPIHSLIATKKCLK